LHELLVAGRVNLVTDSPKSLWSNVLVLPDFKAGDRVKFDSEGKISVGSDALSLRGRHLQGAVFVRGHLDQADFTGAELQRAEFGDAELRKARFKCDPNGSENICAQLQGAFLVAAQLQGADLAFAQLQGADLGLAQLQGADLGLAQLQGASLTSAQLQGANLLGAQLQGAGLNGAGLQGADLRGAGLQDAALIGAELQGADLRGAGLQGADLTSAGLQAANIDGALVWRANAPPKDQAKDLWGEPITAAKLCANPWVECDWTPASFAALKALIEGIPAGPLRDAALKRIAVLEPPPGPGDADDWAPLADQKLTYPQYLAALAATLQENFCKASPEAIAGLMQQLDGRFRDDPQQEAKLAGAFLNEAKCPGAHRLSEDSKAELRQIGDRAKPPPPSAPPTAGAASR
jgi:uncharacterized protein YjbI with pentapeptide repeats